MECLTVQTALEAYVDGDLDPEEARSLELHLADCAGCQQALTRLRAVEEALVTWPLVVEPASLTDEIMARVRTHAPIPPFRLRWIDLAISTCGAGLVFLSLLVYEFLLPTRQVHLCGPKIHVQLRMLQLKAWLWLRTLTLAVDRWWPFLAGLGLIVLLGLVGWALLASRPTLGRAKT